MRPAVTSAELKVFPQPSGRSNERLGRSDLVWVGVARWPTFRPVGPPRSEPSHAACVGFGSDPRRRFGREHLLALGGTTDSFGPTLRPATNGLAMLPYGNGVHYDSEAQRRPLLHQLVANGTLPPVCLATDDGVGIWYQGTIPSGW